MRYITGQDASGLVDFPAVIDAVTEAYRVLGTGQATDVPRSNVGAPGLRGDLKVLPAASPMGLGGVVYSGGWGARAPDEAQMLTVVYDEEG
ncbi:MAG: hypothetical protein R3324_06595, partial [Halobacteriales archaeon]|nr:hypothetical protein [Halobacteriales archaeon]